jgi:hypothetical protein
MKIFSFFLVLISLFLLQGCYTTSVTNRSESKIVFGIDFRKYAEKDFLFMPDEYFGEYEVLGIITAELHPEVVYKKGKVKSSEGYRIRYFHTNVDVSQIVKIVRVEDLIEHIHHLAVEWGGDAFTHFKSNIEIGNTDNMLSTQYEYYSISGVVIKRK